MEIDPATANMVLEDLGIDLLNHLEVNGAAVRVPEQCITLRDEVEPDQLLRMESQVSEKSFSGHRFGEICFRSLDIAIYFYVFEHLKQKNMRCNPVVP